MEYKFVNCWRWEQSSIEEMLNREAAEGWRVHTAQFTGGSQGPIQYAGFLLQREIK